jgi:hypothetical protein
MQRVGGRRATTPWLPILLLTALCLVIPAAVLLGQWRPIGPIAISGGASLSAFAVFWLFLGGTTGPFNETPGGILVLVLVLLGGVLLLGVAWTLALNAATQAHRWGWVALLTLAGELSVAALLISVFRPDPCLFGAPSIDDSFAEGCTTPNPAAQLLVVAGYLAGPVAAMIYSLRSASPRRQGLPEGLSVSPLSGISDPDAESEICSEPL